MKILEKQKNCASNVAFFLRIAAFLLVSSSLLLGETETEHLRFYASFDDGFEPEIALDGSKLKEVFPEKSQASSEVGEVFRNDGIQIPKTEGKFGEALLFERGGKISDLWFETGKIMTGNEWTIAFWMKLKEAGNSQYGVNAHSRGVFRTNQGWGSGNVFATFDQWGKFNVSHFDGNGKDCGASLPSAAFPADKWIHFALTFRDGAHFVYLNGNEASYLKKTDCATPPKDSVILRLGSMDFRSGDFLDGSIDELKLFNKALSSEEIRGVMNTTPGRKDSVALYLPLDGEITGRGFESFSASNLIFTSGSSNDGVKIMRHGYDRFGSVVFHGVKGSRKNQALVFDFIPDWDGSPNSDSDAGKQELSAIHALFGFWSRELNYDLAVLGQKLVFTLQKGDEKQEIALSRSVFQQGKKHRVAAGFDFAKGKMFLAVNDRRIETELTLPKENAEGEVSGTVSLGNREIADAYSRTQAEGVFDEVLLLNDYRTPESLEVRQRIEISRNARSVRLGVAILPIQEQEKAIWSLDGAERIRTATRERITLNALWRMQLTDSRRPFNEKDWSYLPVPGRFSGQANGQTDSEFLMRDKNLNKLSRDARYAGRSPYDFVDGWFERAFIADPAWKGRRIVLQIQELSRSQTGTVFLNGKAIAELKRGKLFEIPLPEDQLRFGEENFLTVQTHDSGHVWAWRGIKGDVSLEIRNSVYAQFPKLVTFVKARKLSCEIQLKNDSDEERDVFAEIEIQGENAPAIFRTPTVRLAPGESQTATAETRWDDATLWTPENPYLYSCVFRVREVEAGKNVATLLDELAPTSFGFREFEIRGRDFFLNGQKIHLFTHDSWANSSGDVEEARRVARTLKRLGFNSVRTNFSSKDQRLENIMKVCDEEGLLQFVGLEGVSSDEYVLWNDPEVRENLEQRMATDIRLWQNHPSVVIWFLSVNFLGYGWDYHPLKMADGYLPDYVQPKYRVCAEGVKIMRKYDPIRPYFFQAGGNFGEIHTTNAYFCWWPQTERNAWPAEWSRIGAKPLHIIETSFPYFMSFYGMDLNYPGNRPLFFFENLARYYGPTAYELKDEEMLAQTRNSLNKTPIVWYDSSAFQKLKCDLLTETIPFWRDFDISGICPFAELIYSFERNAPYHTEHLAKAWETGIEDFRKFGWNPDIRKITYQSDLVHDKPLPAAFALQRAMAPKLVWIDGGEEEPVDQGASFRSGESLDKRLVLINDTQSPALFSGKIEFGSEIQRFSETVQPGEIRRLPITFRMPNVGKITEMELKVTLDPEKGSEKEPFASVPEPMKFTVYPQADVSGLGRIFLFDPIGKTAETFRSLGIDFRLVSESKKPGKGLIVLGTECLTPEFFAVARKWKLAENLESGKSRLLVMAQKPEALNLIGMRTEAIYARKVFDRSGKMVGSWAGKTTFAPEKPLPDPSTQEGVASPLWHWSNVNIVSSWPLVRPAEGDFDVLLTCGKDLIYSPLLEIGTGNGRVIFCQLEIEGRTKRDPQAETTLVSILRRNSVWQRETKSPSELLTKNSFSDLPQAERLTLLREKVSAGANAILDAEDAQALGVETRSETVGAFQVTPKGEAFFSMLTARDRFFRYELETTIFNGENVAPLTEPPFVAEMTLGKGRIIFLGLPTEPGKWERELGMKYGVASSHVWCAEILENRLHQIRALVGRMLGEKSESIAPRFEGKKSDSAFPYSFNQAKYPTEKHVRW